MKAQHLHHKSATNAILNLVDTDNFAPMLLRGKALSDDSCWDEFDSEYEEALPDNVFSFIDGE